MGRGEERRGEKDGRMTRSELGGKKRYSVRKSEEKEGREGKKWSVRGKDG